MTAVGAEAGVDLRRLLTPSSVAVVGATDRFGAYGAQAIENLRTVGFTGEVWGINPRRDEVMGVPCVPIGRRTPGRGRRGRRRDPRRRRARGDRAGRRQGLRWCGRDQRRLRRGGRGRGAYTASCSPPRRVTGCRCAGPTATGSCRRATASRCGATRSRAPEPGPVALVSQSGNVAVNALATRRGLRFHTVVASGNQAVAVGGRLSRVPGRRARRRGGRAVPRGRRRTAAVRGAGGVRAGRRAGRRPEGRPFGARAPERRPRTARRWPATSGCFAA